MILKLLLRIPFERSPKWFRLLLASLLIRAVAQETGTISLYVQLEKYIKNGTT